MAEDSIAFSGRMKQSHSFNYSIKKLLGGVSNRQLGRIILIVLASFNTLAIINIPPTYLYHTQNPQPVSFWLPLTHLFLDFNLWSIIAPFVLWVGYMFPVARRHFVRNLIISIFTALLTGFYIQIGISFNNWIFGIGGIQNFWAIFNLNFLPLVRSFTGAFVQCAVILIAQKAYLHYWEYRDREFRLQQAELEALKMQLHPHFLFNTLNAIAALVYVSPPDATKTISQLSDLLRLTLHNNRAQEVTLKEELDFLRKYLQIQQTLLQERLEIVWAVETETLDALVPNMLLQPLVENSIRHGIAPKEDGGKIEIFSRRVGDNLWLEVKDTGLGGESEHNQYGGGIGLKNTVARLQHLYGEKQKIDSSSHRDGWRTTVLIPFREQL